MSTKNLLHKHTLIHSIGKTLIIERSRRASIIRKDGFYSNHVFKSEQKQRRSDESVDEDSETVTNIQQKSMYTQSALICTTIKDKKSDARQASAPTPAVRATRTYALDSVLNILRDDMRLARVAGDVNLQMASGVVSESTYSGNEHQN